MLVLKARPNETIHVNDDITIVVKEIGLKQVSIGFEAPKDDVILRDKIYKNKNRENA